MPIKLDYDISKKKYYYQFGNQKKYYFSKQDTPAQTRAYNKCLQQAKAIKVSQNRN